MPDSLNDKCSNEDGKCGRFDIMFVYYCNSAAVWLRSKHSSGFCQVSVRQRKSRLLSKINSLRMEPLLLRERVLKRTNLRSGWFCVV